MRHNGKRGRVKREDKRCLQISCGVCGHCEELPIEQDGTSSFLQVRKRGKLVTPNADIAIRSSTPAFTMKSGEAAHAPAEPKPQAAGRSVADAHRHQSSHRLAKPSHTGTPPVDFEARKGGKSASTLPLSSARSKARSKSSALQGLLARNREKQEQEKKSFNNSSGLSAFLQDLG